MDKVLDASVRCTDISSDEEERNWRSVISMDSPGAIILLGYTDGCTPSGRQEWAGRKCDENEREAGGVSQCG